VLRPIDRETFKFTIGAKSFQINGPEELKNILTLSDQIEIHHIFGFEMQLDLLANYPIDAVYLHDRYFLSQTPFSDSLQYGELRYEVAGVNIPLNADFKMDSVNWSAKNQLILQRAKKLYAPSLFLAEQYQTTYSDLSIDQIVQEDDLEPFQTKNMSNSGVLQIILISPTNFHKGSEVLLKVAKLLEKEGTKITFIVIGALDLRVTGELAKLRNVELVPQMSRNRLKVKLSEIEYGIGWIPSITGESYSLALSDFLSNGLTVIATNSGAVTERLRKAPGNYLYNPAISSEVLSRLLIVLSENKSVDNFLPYLEIT
jgi:glycosyltransferase involved in cell wall biosynthesis